MSTLNLTWLILFCFVAYFIITDENAAQSFYVLVMNAWVHIRKFFLIIRYHPLVTIHNPIVRYFDNRKFKKMAEQMIEQLKEEGLYEEEEDA